MSSRLTVSRTRSRSYRASSGAPAAEVPCTWSASYRSPVREHSRWVRAEKATDSPLGGAHVPHILDPKCAAVNTVHHVGRGRRRGAPPGPDQVATLPRPVEQVVAK